MIKRFIALTFLCFSYTLLFGQFDDVSLFSSLSGYRNKGYDNNLFTSIEVGTSFWSSARISPELSVGYVASSLKDQARVSQVNNSEIESQIRTQFSSFLLSAGFKIRITEQENYWLFGLAKINTTSNLKFESRLFEGSDFRELELKEKIEEKGNSTFFEFGFGVEGFLDNKEKWIGSLAVVYTTFNVFDNYRETGFDTSTRSINFPSNGGIGLRFIGKYNLK